MTASRDRRPRSAERGQAIVLVAIMMLVLLTGVGVAIDSAVAYYYDMAAGRAASAAALAGVIFVPNQFTSAQAVPSGSGYDATDRAVAEARRNGFDVADTTDQVHVTPALVSGAATELQVTVSRRVTPLFLSLLGVSSYTIQRIAIAQYLPSITIGQPGNQLGSSVSQLGSSGYYVLRTIGSGVDRAQGDAYTPANNPTSGCTACPSDDVHWLSQTRGTDMADTSLPARGGYDYRIVVPTGSTATIQVYNAAFAPDDNSGSGGPGPNLCENARSGSASYKCSSGSSYSMHETDSFTFPATAQSFSTMKYTLFSESNVFTASADTRLSQMIVDPLDARNWNGSPPTYVDQRTGRTITQLYNSDGTPSDALAYHAWMDIAGHAINPNDQGMISYTSGYGPLSGSLSAGQYRLRVDTLEYDGSSPPSDGTAGSSQAHKGYAIRVMDGTGLNPCSGCTVSAIRDFAIFTPITIAAGSGGGAFQIPVFQLPTDYAGRTIAISLFDLGDMKGNGSISVGLIDPRTNALLDLTSSGTTATVWNLGTQLSNYGTSSATVVSQPSVVQQVVTSGNTYYAASKWYEFDVPIPSDYVSPSGYWKLQYSANGGVTASDTFTLTVGLKGDPVHVVQG